MPDTQILEKRHLGYWSSRDLDDAAARLMELFVFVFSFLPMSNAENATPGLPSPPEKRQPGKCIKPYMV
jgi:hypothetical protein